jgi:prevent-host-death family protein
MQSVTSKDLKNRTGEILRMVRAGARVVITDRGRPVAIISPVSLDASGREPRGNSNPDPWAEIEEALAAGSPEHADWREALRRTRRRP